MIKTRSDGAAYRTWFSNGEHEAFADTTPDKGGQNAGFRPHDLLEAALACCVTITAQMFAEKHGIPVRQVRAIVRLNREQAIEPTFEVKMDFDGELTSKQIEQLQVVVQSCPVRKTLSNSIRFAELRAKSPE
jgi:putative redox protein